MIRFAPACLIPLLLAACVAAPATDPLEALRQADGSVAWQGEYAFSPPGGDWYLVTLDEDHGSVAFSRECRDLFPCESTMSYVEEPFGYSRDLVLRQEEFFRRYLWGSRAVFGAPTLQEIDLSGRKALVAVAEGREEIKGQKVWSKVVFVHRGERVIAFSYSQWRPAEAPFDRQEVALFDRFVRSFRFLKPSFYEQL